MDKYFIIELSKYISIKDLLNLSLCSKSLRNTIIDNENLWFFLLNHNYRLRREKIYHYTQKYKINNFQLYKNIKVELFMFGENKYGQLGLGHYYDIDTPTKIPLGWNHITTMISCGAFHTAAVIDGNLYMFGSNFFGESGPDCTLIGTPIKIPLLKNITMVSCGCNHTAVIADNKLYIFGGNYYGQLGLDDNYNRNIPTENLVISSIQNTKMVYYGHVHTIVITNNKLYTFGNNQYGQLGLGHNNNVNTLTENILLKNISMTNFGLESQVSCGHEHSAIIINEKLYMFGYNYHGQLGLGHNNNINIPTEIPSLKNVTMVSCGGFHTIAMAEGKLYTFSFNYYGQLGLGHNNNTNVPMELSLSSYGINLESHQLKISCGTYHSAIIANGKLYIFGCNTDGQLGMGNKDNRNVPTKVPSFKNVVDISCGGYHTAVIAFSLKIDY